MKLTDIGPLRARMHLLESFPVFCASPSVEGLEAHYIFLFFFCGRLPARLSGAYLSPPDTPPSACLDKIIRGAQVVSREETRSDVT